MSLDIPESPSKANSDNIALVELQANGRQPQPIGQSRGQAHRHLRSAALNSLENRSITRPNYRSLGHGHSLPVTQSPDQPARQTDCRSDARPDCDNNSASQ